MDKQSAHRSGHLGNDPFRPTLHRSFDVYYRDAARTKRMDALNATFVADGALVFDIGAHVGDRTGSFLRFGCRVVAVEPQPRIFRALRLLYGRCERAHLLEIAVGAHAGQTELMVNSGNPTVSTVAPAFVAASQDAPGWTGQDWDHTERVAVTTLDALIAAHGRPAFIKIDVEGHEAEVLKGLTTAVSALSFEFTTMHRTPAVACIERLMALGRYEFNVSLGEDHNLQFGVWVDPMTMREELLNYPDVVNSGDIYARRM